MLDVKRDVIVINCFRWIHRRSKWDVVCLSAGLCDLSLSVECLYYLVNNVGMSIYTIVIANIEKQYYK